MSPRKRPSKRRTKPPGLHLECLARERGYDFVAGVDEVGRGCLAGPVVAASVIFEPGCRVRGVRDSKVLSEAERVRLARLIRARALAVGVGICSVAEIDHMNILQASLLAMTRAVSALSPIPEHVLVDGNQPIQVGPWSVETVVRGDAVSHSIAAASIIAKVARDQIMEELDALYPAFNLGRNKGYGTREHYDALAVHGLAACHRKTFRWKREHADQIDLFVAS